MLSMATYYVVNLEDLGIDMKPNVVNLERDLVVCTMINLSSTSRTDAGLRGGGATLALPTRMYPRDEEPQQNRLWLTSRGTLQFAP